MSKRARTPPRSEIDARLDTLKDASDEVTTLLLDATERQWHLTQPDSDRVYTLRPLLFGSPERMRPRRRGLTWRLVVQDPLQPQTFILLGSDTMKIGKVVMPLRTDIRPSSGEVVVAAEFADHVRFWEDFRAALESKQFLNMPARARHPFEKLVQRVAQTLAVASHTRTSDVAVINSGNPQRLLTGTGVNSRVSRSIVTAASASNIAKRNPDGNQRVLS